MSTPQYSFSDLDHILSGIPERTILKGSNKARFKMLTFALISIAISIGLFFLHQKNGGSLKILYLFVFISIFFIIFTKVRWNDGLINIVELTHHEIKIKDINQNIPLDAITDYNYRYDDNDTLTLTISKPISDLALTSKFKGAIGASVVITKQVPYQEIKIIVPYSFTLDGKRLSPEECLNILDSYLSIPEIKKIMITAN